MIRFVTLVAVVDMEELPTSEDVDGGISSVGDVRPETTTLLFLPKGNFHIDGFFVTGRGRETTVGGGDAGAVLWVTLRGPVSNAEGKGKIDSGSNGSAVRLVEELLRDVDLVVDEDFEALLISRAKD